MSRSRAATETARTDRLSMEVPLERQRLRPTDNWMGRIMHAGAKESSFHLGSSFSTSMEHWCLQPGCQLITGSLGTFEVLKNNSFASPYVCLCAHACKWVCVCLCARGNHSKSKEGPCLNKHLGTIPVWKREIST